MDDGWVHPLAQTPPFSRHPTCDEMLSWMIEIWMESLLVSDSNCNTVIYNPSPKKIYKEWQIMLGWYLVLVTLYHGLHLVSSKIIRIGDARI